mgnify:CR=1 FL=1
MKNNKTYKKVFSFRLSSSVFGCLLAYAIVDWEPGRYALVEFATFRPDLSLRAFRDKFDDFKSLWGRIYYVKSLSLII